MEAWSWLIGDPLRSASLALVAAFALAVAAAFSARWWWIGELLSHWTRHCALVLGVLALSLAGQGQWTGSGLAAGFAAVALIDWWRAAGEERAPTHAGGATLTLVTANLLKSNRRRAQAIAAIARHQPELVILIEVMRVDEDALRSAARWPHQAWFHDDGGYGTALLSVHPIVNARLIDERRRGVIVAEIVLGAQRLPVIACHPYSPGTPRQWRMRNAQLATIAALVAVESRPMLVAGDLNLTVGNPHWRDFRRFSGLRRAARTGLAATYPASLGVFGIGIDHVLVRDLAIRKLRVFALPGSDHRALAAEIAGIGVAPPPSTR